MPNDITILLADLELPAHAEAIRALTNAYAADAFGREAPLDEAALERLLPGLRTLPTTLIFLAYAAEEPVGIANCFRGFSTFHARPLVNIHDLAVLPAWRGRGIGQQLLTAVAEHARQLGCCKVTLEVGSENHRALALYHATGFTHAGADSPAGAALFYEKLL